MTTKSIIKRKTNGESHNPQLAEVLDDAKKEKDIPLHVMLPESLMKRLRLHAVNEDKSLRAVIMEMLQEKL
jgi:hypothetical protein